MGEMHAAYLRKGDVKRVELTAVCDSDQSRLANYSDIKTFADTADMVRSGEIDALLIATPHYSHTTLGIDALEQGLHVLVEKPISVHKADCERLIAAHTNPKQVFAAMFNMRTGPAFQKIKMLVDEGHLGEIVRTNWTATHWFRPEAYYASGGWRATWKGEGGGVLLNQCPHQLDLFIWLFGMPSRVHGFCGFGARHNIEVEDQVTAYLEYPNGATGVFIAGTGEAPGTNRLEVAADAGKVVYENDRLTFTRNEVPTSTFTKTSKKMFSRPDFWNVEIPVGGVGGQHAEITQNFVDAILDGVPLTAPAEEGIKSVELANAIIYSELKGKPVDLPLDGAEYEAELQRLIDESPRS